MPYKKGYKHSEKTKNKISEKNKISIKRFYDNGGVSGMKGKTHTPEARIKITLANMGNKKRLGKKFPHTEDAKKRISKSCKERGIGKWMKGRKLSKETKEKISKSLSGKNSPSWLGGKSFESYSVDWTETLRRSIRERDKYTCKICRKGQGDIAHDVHHINYDKKNCNPDNLITLCHSCHSKVHSKREYWSKYFNQVISK